MVGPSVRIDFYARKRRLRDFVAESNFILSVIVVPNVHPSILANEEEDSVSGWGPAAVGEVGSVIFCPHNRGL